MSDPERRARPRRRAVVVFGLVPALRASRSNVVSTLKDKTCSLGSSRRRFGLTNVLVVSQLSVSLILLVAAGLFLRGLVIAQHVNPGFETRNAAIATIPWKTSGMSEAEGREFFRELVDRLKTYPGVTGVALAERVHRDARPVTDDGLYYVVRAVNACGPGPGAGWGRGTRPEPRPACP